MTLLQTRVEDRVAKRFEQAAKAQGKSPYALLAQTQNLKLWPALTREEREKLT